MTPLVLLPNLEMPVNRPFDGPESIDFAQRTKGTRVRMSDPEQNEFCESYEGTSPAICAKTSAILYSMTANLSRSPPVAPAVGS